MLAAVFVGIVLLGLLALGAQLTGDPEHAEQTSGPTSPDGTSFMGPTAPPPTNPDYTP